MVTCIPPISHFSGSLGGLVRLLYLTLRSETDEGVAKDKVFARTENWARDTGSKAQQATH